MKRISLGAVLSMSAVAAGLTFAPANAAPRGCDVASIPQSPICTTQTRTVEAAGGLIQLGETRHRKTVYVVTPTAVEATFTRWSRWQITSVVIGRG